MNNEKELDLDFFKNKRNTPLLSEPIDEKLDSNKMSQLKEITSKKHPLINLLNKFGLKVSSSILLLLLGTNMAILLTMLYLSITFMSGAGVVASLVVFFMVFNLLFRYVDKSLEIEESYEFRNLIAPYVDDFEYVLGKFGENENIKLRATLKNIFSRTIDVEILKNSTWVTMFTLNQFDFNSKNPADWLLMIKNKYHNFLKQEEEKIVSEQLEKIKIKDRDIWLKLLENGSIPIEVRNKYNELF